MKKLHLWPCEKCRANGKYVLPRLLRDPRGFFVRCECGATGEIKKEREFAADSWNGKQLRSKHVKQGV